MTEGTEPGGEAVKADDTEGTTADTSGQAVVAAFGQTLKTLRLRAGLEREEFGRRIGYSASTIASYEQGRRVPSPRTIERADEVLGADGLLTVWKEQVERAQYPVFFQGMASLEKVAIELLSYDTLVVKGLLQTEAYMRAVLAMRRPPRGVARGVDGLRRTRLTPSPLTFRKREPCPPPGGQGSRLSPS